MAHRLIEIERAGKRYRIGAGKDTYLCLRDEIARLCAPGARRAQAEKRDFWALRDVNLAIEEGETVGVIGRNGAGKSTLLKLLSRITPPTEGRIVMHGRVASLLEVGTGFHPELTGRENIHLNGAILGMTRSEVARAFDEIVAFSEVERFLDTPVKRYSSGMYVRLAFAVAAHLQPEILLVDEVLSVGDAEFQRKCLGRMSEVAKTGRTVVFVSHNMAAITRLCRTGVVIENGRVAFFGSADEAVKHYTDSIRNREATQAWRASEPGCVAGFERVVLTDARGDASDTFFVGDEVRLTMDVFFDSPVRSAQIGFIISSVSAGNIYHCVSRDAGLAAENLRGRVTFTATFPRLALYPGEYAVKDLCVDTPSETLQFVPEVLRFRVAEGGPAVCRRLSAQAAVVHEVPKWKLVRHETETVESAPIGGLRE